MTIHKQTRLMPIQRREIWDKYCNGTRICDLSRYYHVSRNTVYNVIRRARKKDFSIHNSANKRFRCLQYGLKRLSKIEAKLEKKLKQQAKRYNKDYPGEMIHADVRRLPVLKGELKTIKHEYLYVAIDDFSRELYAAILEDKTQFSSRQFLEQVYEECPYTIEQWYTDHGREWEGNPKHYVFAQLCQTLKIEQRFTRVRRLQTNGKAERVIRTIMDKWHNQTKFKNRVHRKTELIRFVNWYNTVKPHKGIDNQTPMEKLINYFYPSEL